MTGNNYQDLAMRTKNKNLTKNEQLRNAAYGLNGEAGEVIDLLKKHEFQGHPLKTESLVDELGDLLWYIALACDALGVKLEDAMRYNVDKLRKRYPEGFDAERSIHRESTRDV